MTKIEIKTLWGEIIFTHEKENNTFKDTLQEAVKSHADLRNADLRGADLRGADLSGAYLSNAYLSNADLSNADLSNADLRGADLRGAYLRGAYLSNAYLSNADLSNAYLRGAYLRGAYLSNAYLSNADLSNADLRGADLSNADLRGAYLSDEWGKLNSAADVFVVGPLGSRNDYSTFYHTDKGIFVRCGCFHGNLDAFISKVKETHDNNQHARNYLAIAEFVKQKYNE